MIRIFGYSINNFIAIIAYFTPDIIAILLFRNFNSYFFQIFTF